MAAGVVDGAIIVDTGIKTDKAKVGAKDFINMVEQMAGAVNKVGQQMSGSVNGYIQAMNRARSAAKALTGDQAAIAKEILSTTSALKKLEERQELAQRKWEAAREDAIAKASEEFTRNNAGAELLPWENEEQAAEQFAEDMQAVINDVIEKFGSFEDTAAFRNMSAEVEFLTDKLENLKAMLAEAQQQPAGDSGDGMAEGSKEAAENTREVAENTREAGTAANAASSAFQAFGSVVGRAASGFVHLAGSAARAGASIVRIAGGGALSFLRKLAEGARNAAIQLAKLSGRAISGGFKTLGQGILAAGKWMLGLKSSTQQANGGFKRGLMTILKYGLGIRSLYFLFRKLRTAITESFTELAKHDSRTNNSINSLKTALAGLKGSLATAFAPIFNAVAPALTYLINMLTAAINAIGAFMAALTGQSTYQKAVAGLEAAGGAAGGAGDAASDAADDYKELKRELAGFDDLDILGSKDSSSGSGSSGGGGGGGGGAGGGFTYETEEIASGITDFIGKLKEMWENADYEGIGRAIADCINSAFTKARDLISWDNLGDTITEAVNAITGIFNGLVDGIDWTLIGETFGEGINTIIRTVNLLLTGINWENLGKGFANGLNGLVDTVSWSELGQLFANKLNALISTIKGVVSNFNWGNAGAAFATTVNSLMDGINWDNLKETAVGAINGLLASMRIAVREFSWKDAAQHLVDLANGLLDGIEWDDLKETAVGAINGLLASMRLAVREFSWKDAAQHLVDLANGLLDGIEWDDLVATASDGLNQIIASMRIIVRGFSWDTAGTTFANMVNSLFSGDTRVNWTALGETAAAAIGGPLETIRSAVSTFSFGDAAKAFADTVNGFFSNEKLWADAGTIVSDSIKGLFTWGADFLSNLDTDKISNDIKVFMSKLDWPGIAKAIWGFLKAALQALGDLAVDLLSPIQEDLENYTPVPNPYTGEIMWVSIPPEGMHIEGDHWELDEPAEGDVDLDVPPDAGDKVKGLWDKMKPSLKSDVDPELPSDSGEKVKGLWDKTKPELKTNVGYTLSPADSNQTLAKKIGTALGVLYTLSRKDANQTLANKIGTALTVLYTLSRKDAYQTLANKIGTALGVLYTLGRKDANQTLANKIGTALSVLYTLSRKDANQTLANKIGTALGVLYTLSRKDANQTLAKKIGTALSVAYTLSKSDKNQTLTSKIGTALSVAYSLHPSDKKQTLASKIGTSLSVAVSLSTSNLKKWVSSITSSINNALKNITGKAGGGAITNSGREIDFASGGVIRGGLARYLGSVPHYAGGTTRAHGTVFVAGESGPEIMGHINGRTEILNKSQLAQAIYSAVVSGMGQAVNALGTFLAGQMAACTNAITGTIGNLSAIRSLEYHAPVMATGSVMPYEVSAQIAKTGEDIQNTLNSNNEDLIQTIVSVAGQIVAAVQASGRSNTESAGPGGLTVQQVIRQINQRTQMFGGSPLLD